MNVRGGVCLRHGVITTALVLVSCESPKPSGEAVSALGRRSARRGRLARDTRREPRRHVRVRTADQRRDRRAEAAIAPDGKTLWERKGALTGGATITSDDRLLVATDAKIVAIDPSGRASEIASAPKQVFLTPPIVTASGLLLAASGSMLHAYAFE